MRVRYRSMGMHQKEDLIEPMRGWHLVVIVIGDWSQVQDELCQRYHMLEVRRPFGGDGQVKIFLREAFPWWCMGEQFAIIQLASVIKKGCPTWGDQDRHYLDQVDCARQRYKLDRFSILPVSWCYLGDRFIGSIAVLSRGALEWVAWSHRS
jgi:hypothetical protein